MAQGNSYEKLRNQRLADNKRRLEELGVLKMAKSLSEKTKSKTPVVSDHCGYIATRVATNEERSDALKSAMSFKSGLLSGNPSCVKSLSFADVSERFELYLPWEIRNHLPKKTKVRIVLEDEEGSPYETSYYWTTGYLTAGKERFSMITGYLISGWKTFSMNHKLDDGDALVMELIEPTRIKVHIFRVANDISEVQVDEMEEAGESDVESTTKPTMKSTRNLTKGRYISERVATKEERDDATERAMRFQSGLLSGNPSFVKSMSRSQVAKDFRLNLPFELSNNYLPKEGKVRIMLEDEEGLLYETRSYGQTKRLKVGIRAFSMDHKLDDGDALVIELIEPTRFKVHIIRVSNDINELQVDETEEARESDDENMTRPTRKRARNSKEGRYVAKRNATKEERTDALKCARSFQSSFLSTKPSVVKSMRLSEVSGEFTLHLPIRISNKLPKIAKMRIVLEDDKGSLYETHCDRRITYPRLRAGWRAFSRDHKLDDGDALVIEFINPTRLKIHIFKVSNDNGEVQVDETEEAIESIPDKTEDAEEITKRTGRRIRNSKKDEHCATEIN